MAWIRRRNPPQRITVVDIHAEAERLRELGIGPRAALARIHALDEQGRVLTGMDALRALYRLNGKPRLAAVLERPAARWLLDRWYPWFACGRRHWPAGLLAQPG